MAALHNATLPLDLRRRGGGGGGSITNIGHRQLHPEDKDCEHYCHMLQPRQSVDEKAIGYLLWQPSMQLTLIEGIRAVALRGSTLNKSTA